MGYVQDKGETAGDVLQEVGKKSVDTLQEAGRQSMDTIQQVHADTRDLGNDMRDNPDKYVQKAKQQYKETYDKLEDQASKLGQQANEAMDSMKYSAKVLQRKAARGLKRIEHEIGRARSWWTACAMEPYGKAQWETRSQRSEPLNSHNFGSAGT